MTAAAAAAEANRRLPSLSAAVACTMHVWDASVITQCVPPLWQLVIKRQSRGLRALLCVLWQGLELAALFHIHLQHSCLSLSLMLMLLIAAEQQRQPCSLAAQQPMRQCVRKAGATSLVTMVAAEQHTALLLSPEGVLHSNVCYSVVL